MGSEILNEIFVLSGVTQIFVNSKGTFLVGDAFNLQG